jgi:hypothetical protein
VIWADQKRRKGGSKKQKKNGETGKDIPMQYKHK